MSTGGLDLGPNLKSAAQVLLHNPHNHLYHQRQAEIRYTWGGYEQLELVR